MASPTLSSIEFIAQEGGYPVPVDLFSEHYSHHLGIFAMSGSGRQPLTLDIITHTLAAGIPVFALDYPAAHNNYHPYGSTLKNFTRALDGEYGDCWLEDGNLFELPDTRGLDPSCSSDGVQEIQSEYIDYLELTFTCTMVLGDNSHCASSCTLQIYPIPCPESASLRTLVSSLDMKQHSWTESAQTLGPESQPCMTLCLSVSQKLSACRMTYLSEMLFSSSTSA